MTKEDVSEPVEGDTVLGCRARLSSHQRPVIHQVASAPMPSDCGEYSRFLFAAMWHFKLVNAFSLQHRQAVKCHKIWDWRKVDGLNWHRDDSDTESPGSNNVAGYVSYKLRLFFCSDLFLNKNMVTVIVYISNYLINQ